jgi:hypothetical protein
MKEFPKKIYVRKEQEVGDEFLIADEDPKQIANCDTTTVVGEYRLVRIVSLINKTEIVEDE